MVSLPSTRLSFMSVKGISINVVFARIVALPVKLALKSVLIVACPVPMLTM
jgi:hypothetical protein